MLRVRRPGCVLVFVLCKERNEMTELNLEGAEEFLAWLNEHNYHPTPMQAAYAARILRGETDEANAGRTGGNRGGLTWIQDRIFEYEDRRNA